MAGQLRKVSLAVRVARPSLMLHGMALPWRIARRPHLRLSGTRDANSDEGFLPKFRVNAPRAGHARWPAMQHR